LTSITFAVAISKSLTSRTVPTILHSIPTLSPSDLLPSMINSAPGLSVADTEFESSIIAMIPKSDACNVNPNRLITRFNATRNLVALNNKYD